MVNSQLFLASDEVLLKYHPPLIKTKGQGAEGTSHCVINPHLRKDTNVCFKLPISFSFSGPKEIWYINLLYFAKPILNDGHYWALRNRI